MQRNLAIDLIEDRALRDAAKSLVKIDIEHVKADFKGQSLKSRFSARISEGANEVLDEAVEVAENNKGVVAALVAALVLWFARNPILSLFDEDSDDEETWRNNRFFNF
ncbi:MAG: hypothetical protein WA908_07510 [Pontixanthobacter sp.]